MIEDDFDILKNMCHTSMEILDIPPDALIGIDDDSPILIAAQKEAVKILKEKMEEDNISFKYMIIESRDNDRIPQKSYMKFDTNKETFSSITLEDIQEYVHNIFKNLKDD